MTDLDKPQAFTAMNRDFPNLIKEGSAVIISNMAGDLHPPFPPHSSNSSNIVQVIPAGILSTGLPEDAITQPMYTAPGPSRPSSALLYYTLLTQT